MLDYVGRVVLVCACLTSHVSILDKKVTMWDHLVDELGSAGRWRTCLFTLFGGNMPVLLAYICTLSCPCGWYSYWCCSSVAASHVAAIVTGHMHTLLLLLMLSLPLLCCCCCCCSNAAAFPAAIVAIVHTFALPLTDPLVCVCSLAPTSLLYVTPHLWKV